MVVLLVIPWLQQGLAPQLGTSVCVCTRHLQHPWVDVTGRVIPHFFSRGMKWGSWLGTKLGI